MFRVLKLSEAFEFKMDLKEFAIPLDSFEYGNLLSAIGEAQVVCIGDSSHGSFEFYEQRALISKLLIEKKGFNIIAAEADWPDCATINRYIHSQYQAMNDPLTDFTRFPKWMWRNEVIEPFIKWMKDWNASHENANIDFYGLDMYSLQKSTEAVIKYLESVDPSAALKARGLYKCFDKFHEDPLLYSLSVKMGIDKGCREETLNVLHHLLRKQVDASEDDEKFIAEINALVVKDAEEYYRCTIDENMNSWNIRDSHMFNTLKRLLKHTTARNGFPSKAIIWAHNSHVGDARFTDMGTLKSEINIGQLCREKLADKGVYIIGFLGNEGTVMAANNWGLPGRVKKINPSLQGSYENLFHQHFPGQNILLIFRELEKRDSKYFSKEVDGQLNEYLSRPRLERYIGVIYCPDSERWSHYSSASLSNQYDAVIYMDQSRAITPLGVSQ